MVKKETRAKKITKKKTPKRKIDLAKRDKELRQLATDIADQKVFMDRHFPTEEQAIALGPSVFMPIALGAFAKKTKKQLNNIGLIYEYHDKVGPRSINGYPIFMSCSLLTLKDAKFVWDLARKYHAMKEKVKSDLGVSDETEKEVEPPA